MRINYWLLVVLAPALSMGVCMFPLALYFYTFHGDLSTTQSDWGVFGEYVSGTVGTLFSAAAFLALLVTLWQQRKQIAITEQTNQRAQLESSLMHLLTVLGELLRDTDLRSRKTHKVVAQGRDAFRNIYLRKFSFIYRRNSSNPLGTMSEREIVRHSVDELYRRFGSDFGHYFRTLYRAVVLVSDATFLTDDERGKYIALITCRLSKFELLLLFYNCLGSIGERKFRHLAERFCLFENLDSTLVKNFKHITFFATSAYMEKKIAPCTFLFTIDAPPC